MIVSRSDYFKNIGFREDPFASTNALQEDFIEEYFIRPPYYASLVGSLDKPKSSFVIAPRGTGKTAQRVMLEKLADKEKRLIAVVYDNFPVEKNTDIGKISLEDHLIRIMKILIIAILSEANSRIEGILLNNYEKKQLVKLINLYLCGITPSEIEDTIKKLKGISGRLHDVWIKANIPITAIISIIMKKINLDGQINLNGKNQCTRVRPDEISSHYDFVELMFAKMSIASVFILVDSIDETSGTGNNAEKSYSLIRPFILDLRLLERSTIVFKFFVWNKIAEYWSEDFRKDRIEHFEITWRQEEIKELLRKRLNAYSYGKITEIKDILNCDDNILQLIYLFSNNSPRDAINILKSIFDEHLRICENIDTMPGKHEILLGIELFCKNKFDELIIKEKQRNDLKRVKIATFTIPYLYNEVFKCESSTARNILMPWTQSGLVINSNNKIRTDSSPNPINIYTFSDLRVARFVCSNQKLEDFVHRNIHICNECNTPNIFDNENKYGLREWQCRNCMEEIFDCSTKDGALMVNKKKRNTSSSKYNQISIFDE